MYLIFLHLLILLSSIAFDQVHKPDYKNWDVFLQKYVTKDGWVDYQKIKQKQNEIKTIVIAFSKFQPNETWSKDEQMAFWINVYNANTIYLVVQNYPIKSIQTLDNGKPWDVKRIKIANKKYSLNDIENTILRKEFKDARVHFALNCAAKSCPPLMNRAYLPKALNQQLEDRTKNFFQTSTYQRIASENAQLSKILEWYASDFGNLVTFINRYSNHKISAKTKLTYLEYDWSLNSK